jgi:hypothetical protein
MKLSAPSNDNYAAVVTNIKAITPLEGCDNVVSTPLFGFQAIVGKATQVGELGIVFPAESQLSEEYAKTNNLHRHGDLNADQGQQGYLEDNRRVKAMKFRGHRSDCLFMPLSSLIYTGIDIGELHEGDVFDTLNGHEICKKYLRKQLGTPRIERNKIKKFMRVDTKFLPEHYDSENYWRNAHVVPQDRKVIVTQKLHGTSVRIGHTMVLRQLNWFEHLLIKLRVAELE